jgi:2-methylcitrate dehydratase PrpD
MRISEQIVEYIVNCKFEDVSTEIIEEKKKNILDILGVMIAGSDAPGCRTVINEIISIGGRKDALISSYQEKVPVHNAAIANCMMARSLDFDDVFPDSIIHINATNVPVAFVISDFVKGISGKQFLTAMTIAADIAARMGLANFIPSNISGYSFTFQFASIIAAIVSGKLMGLNCEKMQNALGIAYSQLAGNNQGYVDGAMTIRLQQGFSAGAGVLAAVFANQGITGAKDIFAGKFGYYNVFAQGQYDQSLLTKEIGRTFYGTTHTIKPYPCCTHLHGAIDGVLELCAENAFSPQEVERVEIGVNQSAYNLCCEPIEQKSIPKSVVDLQFSFNYVAAAALIEGKVDLDSIRKEALANSELLDFGENRVFPFVDETLGNDSNKSITKTNLKIVLKDGSILEKSIPFAKGSKERPMTMQECEKKFGMCLRKAIRPITNEQIEKAVDKIQNFEKLADVRELYTTLC